MRFYGTNKNARISGLAGLAGAAAMAVNAYTQRKEWMRDIYSQPYPDVLGERPSDEVLLSDPDSYIRTVLANHDWAGVYRWYAVKIAERYQNEQRAFAYWDIAILDLSRYFNGYWTLGDLRAFTEIVLAELVINDLGVNVGFGYPSPLWSDDFGTFLAGLSGNDGATNYWDSYRAIKSTGFGPLTLGWQKDRSTFGRYSEVAMYAIGAAIIGAGIFGLASGGAGATVAETGTAAAATEGGAVAVGTSVAAVPAGIEVVTVAAAPIVAAPAAGTIGAGIAAGGIAVAAAPPAIAPPEMTVPPIETVVVQAAPVVAPPISGTVASAAAAGTIVATTAPPIIGTEVIETVTVEAPAPSAPVDPETAAIIGATSIPLTQPIIEVAEPTLPEFESNESPSMTDRIRTALSDAVAELGGNYVRNRLAEILTDELGRPPTPSETSSARDWINRQPVEASLSAWLMLLLFGGAILASLKKKRGRKVVRRRRMR